MDAETVKVVTADLNEAMRRVIQSGMVMGGSVDDDTVFNDTVSDILAVVNALRTLKKRAAALVPTV